jgi:hypothetical protein
MSTITPFDPAYVTIRIAVLKGFIVAQEGNCPSRLK